MPRPRTQTDKQLLEASLALMHARGPDTLTFASLSEACGLAAATLVQRFGSKATLKQRTLLHAWDRLDERTAQLAATVPRTPEGAVALLVGLSEQYGGIKSYAEGLLVLREDLRDPLLRARGAAWKTTLIDVLDGCAPGAPDCFGLLMATHWQGALLWWSFDPEKRLEEYVEQSLERLISSLVKDGADR